MTASPVVDRAVPTAPAPVDLVLRGRCTGEQVHRFLTEDAPAHVLAALQFRGTGDGASVRCRVTRSKLKPDRKLAAYLDVGPNDHDTRAAAATWTAVPGTGAVLSVLVAPTDPAFPQLAGLYDPARLARRLVAAGQGPLDPGLTVTPVRYRPGQRHVLRVDGGSGRPRFYAKVYRDDTGRRAVSGSRQVADALAAWGGPARAARAVAYLEPERVVLWAAGQGTPLSWSVAHSPTLAACFGAALRAVHDSGGVFGAWGSGRSDPAGEGAVTRRSAQHVLALNPAAGEHLLWLLDRTVATLAALPAEHGHRLHGDAKADNVLVEDAGLRLLDFDRVTVGDPALDLGKLAADLRWWAMRAATDGDCLVAALLDGYGPCPTPRRERAHQYDVLFQLRAVGRRVLLHEPDWDARVDSCLQLAQRTARSRS